MDVQCGEEASVKYAAGYVAAAGAYLALLLVPGALWPGYYVVCGSIVFAVITFFAVRSHVQALFALGAGQTPRLGDDELPGVSLIIPCFNEAGVLPETIPAVLAVDYPAEKLEILYVYESACTDRTEQILRVFGRRDGRIKVVCRATTNGGKAPITNFGIGHASHGIIGILDADHMPDRDLVRIAAASLRDAKVGCVRGRCRTRNEGQSILTRLVAIERDIVERLGICGACRTGGFANFGGGQGFFRREIFEQIGLFDEDVLTEDIDYSVRMQLAGYDVRVLPAMQSWEEAPPSWKALYNQRKRWCRGWIQIWRRYAVDIVKASGLGVFRRGDMLVSLFSSLAPGLLIGLIPILTLAALGVTTCCYGRSASLWLWVYVTVTPPSLGWAVWMMDQREEESPGPGGLLFLPLLVPYMLGLIFVNWVGFVDEFLLERPFSYVKTGRVGDAAVKGHDGWGGVEVT